MATGKIKTLYSDKEKTEVLFPKTKTSAVSDENGRGLDSLIKDVSYFSDTNSSQIEAIPNDADTLGGRPASEYATQDYVKDKIIEAQFSNNDIDVSNFVTKEDLEQIDFPVDSVNGQTGAVSLSASDVGARPDTWTPTAAQVGAAPSGYGLGDGGIFPTSLGLTVDTIARGGFYRWDIHDGAPFSYATMIVAPRTGNASAAQLAFCHAGVNRGVMATRMYSTSADNPWEYINPPMVEGVEYRTTERYMGKAVYAKLVNFGTLPNATSKMVAYRGNGSTGVVSMTAMLSDGCCVSGGVCMDRNFSNVDTFSLDSTMYNVRIVTSSNWSSLSAYVLVKYTLD